MNDRLYIFCSVAVLLIVAAVGGLSLYETFSGDQALFVVYARELDAGAVLYRDIWDIKQPGIFVFYLLAGRSFGFNEFGVHLLELLYWLGLSLILIIGLRDYFKNPFFALLTPLLTVGIYYSVSGSWHLTQAESLVCFPLFLTLLFGQKYLESPDRRRFLFWSGVCGGLTVLFKQMLIVIPAFFWLGILIIGFFSLRKKEPKQIFTAGGLILLGFIAAFLPVALYFFQTGSFGDLWYTTFGYPFHAALFVTDGDRTQILKNGLIWFVKSYFPVIVLAAIGLLFQIKNRQNTENFDPKSGSFFFNGFYLWVFLGLLVILIQRLSWWEYHYSLLMLPLGILAVKALENVWESLSSGRHLTKLIVCGLVLLLFAPTARRLKHKVHEFVQAETVALDRQELKISGSNLENYRSVTTETAFLRTENPRATVFVMADPLYYYLSGASPAISSNGWMPTLFTDFEWQKLNREMNEKKPGYVILEKSLGETIRQKDPEFIGLLDRSYTLFATGEKVFVYRLNKREF